MLRIATVIYYEGTFRGGIVLNFKGQFIIDQINNLAKDPEQIWLLNDEGYWLAGRTAEEEWAFMWPQKNHVRLSEQAPSIWQAFAERSNILLDNRDGLYTPGSIRNLKPDLNGKERHWKLLAFTPRSHINTTMQQYAGNLITGLVVISVLIFISCLLVIKKDKIRDQAEKQQRKSELRFQTLLESAPDAIITIDSDLTILIANSMAGSTLSINQAELINCKIAQIVPPERLQELNTAIHQSEHTKNNVYTLETELLQSDGSTIPVEARISPTGDEQGLYIICFRDISQRKAHDQKVQELNASLMKRGRELETINAELEAFSYSVSHDLRAPLRALDGFSKTLLTEYSDKLDTRGRDRLGRIRSAAQKMGALIDDMLNLSKVSRTEVKRADVDLSSMANNILSELQQRAPKANRCIQIQGDMHAEADPKLLQIALTNLLENAWKFTAKTESPRIEVTQSTDTDTGSAVYSVSDNGAGFNMQYKNKLFTAFQRLHDAREYPGTGVGLATVKRVVSKHGGRIWADATEGKGASFHFTLGETA